MAKQVTLISVERKARKAKAKQANQANSWRFPNFMIEVLGVEAINGQKLLNLNLN